jgi:hypothetical protein
VRWGFLFPGLSTENKEKNTVRFGKITKINLREAWPNEFWDFTPWAAKNINALGEASGMDLEMKHKEAAVGSFSLDLLVKDLGKGMTVVIENYLQVGARPSKRSYYLFSPLFTLSFFIMPLVPQGGNHEI